MDVTKKHFFSHIVLFITTQLAMKTKPEAVKGTNPGKKDEELKTEPPISEKDEVKQAEKRTAKAADKRANS
jgi:hypothetical protein